MAKVLFITHFDKECGVYQYGANIAKTLIDSKKHTYIHIPCQGPEDMWKAYRWIMPQVIIYNFIPETLPWLFGITPALTAGVKQLAIVHEPNQAMLQGMDGLISQDPTVPEEGLMFSPGRLILDYKNPYPTPEIPTFGSFGFGFPGKGFDKLVTMVQEQYDVAKIRLHIAPSASGDPNGAWARTRAEQCRALITKPGIQLEVDHEFLDVPQLLDWLAQNSINAFLYDYFDGRGISGPPDYALSARRPIALTKSYMFKHMWNGASPSIFVEDLPIKTILENGIEALDYFYSIWSATKIIENYDRMIDTCLTKY